MDRWNGRIAIVTGASSGIGWAIVKDLLAAGMTVIGFARRLSHMEELRSQLADHKEREAFHPRECDLTSLPSIKANIHWVEHRFKRLHVLVNNAGIAEFSCLLDEGNEAALRRVVDVNLMGTVLCTKESYRIMQLSMAAGEECHIITVNSLLGHTVPPHIPELGYNLYPVTKHALLATNEVLRRELYHHKLMRLSTISPGLTNTNFCGHSGNKHEREEDIPDPSEILQPDDVSRGVVFILSSPQHVTIADLVMVPSRERY